MKAKNLKAYQSPRHHFPGKKARRISFIPFLLLLCMLTTLAGCQHAKPLRNSIFMADGTIKQMAETVTFSSGLSDIDCGLPPPPVINILLQSAGFIIMEYEGVVLDGADYERIHYSILKGTVKHTFFGDMKEGETVLFEFNGTSQQVFQGMPISAFQKSEKYFVWLHNNERSPIRYSLEDILANESVDTLYFTSQDIIGFIQNADEEQDVIALKLPDAKFWGAYTNMDDNPEQALAWKKQAEDSIQSLYALLEMYNKGITESDAKKIKNRLENEKAMYEDSHIFSILTVSDFEEFLKHEILPNLWSIS